MSWQCASTSSPSAGGFKAGRSTIDMTFSVRQLQEKCQEQNEPLFLAFVDLTKAFDLASGSGLFQLLNRSAVFQSCTPSSSHSTPTCVARSATRRNIRPILHQQWSQAGLRARPHTLQDLLVDVPDPRFQRERRRSLTAKSIRRQANQPVQTPGQDQGQACHHQRGSLCRRYWPCDSR